MTADSSSTATATESRSTGPWQPGVEARLPGTRISIALALVRIVLGVVFVAHGGQKLFQFGLGGVAGAFTEMGVPLAGFTGPAVAFVEFFGGLALVAGFMTRLAALGVGVVMVGAILMVHVPNGFFAPGGIEFPLTLLAIALALVVAGPGAYGVDGMRIRRREG